MIRKTVTIILSMILVFACAIAPAAATVENAETGLFIEPGIVAAEYDVNGTKLDNDITLPSSYSSKDLGYTTSVRRQQTSDCWTFGSTATLETFTLKKNAQYEQWNAGSWLSPIHMNYWGSDKGTGYGWFRTLMQGGYPYISMGYLMSWQGCLLEDEYPYPSSISSFEGYDNDARAQIAPTSIIYLDADDRYTIKRAIYEYGAVVGNYHENSGYFNYDTYAYYFNKTGLATSSLNGHCISIVGWDDNYSRFNFSNSSTLTGNGAWLCKNSRGPSWGLDGYFWISYEDTYLFSKKFGDSYAIASTRQMTSSTKMYQTGIYGATCEFDINTSHLSKSGDTYDSITYANVFDFEDGFTRIEDVIIESAAVGTKYEIYDIPLENGVPSSDESTWTLISDITTEFNGYMPVDANNYSVDEGKRAIGVKVYANDDGSLPIGCDEWLTSSSKTLFKPNTKKGQSYIIGAEDTAVDLLDYYEDNMTFSGEPDTIGSTFIIKVVASQEHNYGCVSKGNKMTINDATVIQRSIANISSLDSEQTYLADVDYNGNITVSDVTTMQMMLSKTLPVPNII